MPAEPVGETRPAEATDGATRRGRRYDPDRLARLEDERDFLLRSLDDLDREFEAGDIAAADYEELRDGYTLRAAATIRRIDEVVEGRDGPGSPDGSEGPRPRRWRAMVLVVVFATLAGWALARNVGLRTGSDTLTGTIADGAGQVRNCIDESFGDPERGIACFDEVLADTPGNLEAQTYRAWARVRNGDPETGRVELDAVIAADPTYADAYVFRAVVARDDGDPEAAQGYLDTLFALDPPPALLNTLAQMGLERDLAVARLGDGSARCWALEDDALTALNAALTGGDATRDEVGTALDQVLDSDRCWATLLDAEPDDVGALTLRAYGLLNLDLTLRGQSDATPVNPEVAALDDTIGSLLDQVLAAEPDNADALVLRAALRYVTDDNEGAIADLDALGDRRISPLLTGVDADTVRALVTDSGGQ